MSGSRGGTHEEAPRAEPGRATPAEREAARQARTVTQRAIRRLDILEWVIFGAGAAMAALGGALVAWLLSSIAGWAFRPTWIGASLLLFVVPGTIAVLKIRRDERADALRAAERREEDHG
jgi:uncharacterized membrane protein